ncbi:hypothetical protein CKAN_02390400 [Cinnamomum micranthum f. kanehirae]|uniref:Uncharacterized protein n=1 Tax=Cinnamomum micranthum f. kanehirae TaxID=337451 RepID=A0A443PV18_9MAGN|nr:hypothetical protein CKAN_02390400 [Cinnamomum micranthum f. kanehirae]
MESLKGYWRRKDYERLDGSNRFHKKNRVELGRTLRKKRFWRIKSIPRVRFFRVSSPKNLLARLRDAYVRMMLGFASSAGSISYGGGGRTTGFDRPALKEYDEKVIVEIYKSLMAHQQQLMNGPDGATKMGEIVCRR